MACGAACGIGAKVAGAVLGGLGGMGGSKGSKGSKQPSLKSLMQKCGVCGQGNKCECNPNKQDFKNLLQRLAQMDPKELQAVLQQNPALQKIAAQGIPA